MHCLSPPLPRPINAFATWADLLQLSNLPVGHFPLSCLRDAVSRNISFLAFTFDLFPHCLPMSPIPPDLSYLSLHLVVFPCFCFASLWTILGALLFSSSPTVSYILHYLLIYGSSLNLSTCLYLSFLCCHLKGDYRCITTVHLSYCQLRCHCYLSSHLSVSTSPSTLKWICYLPLPNYPCLYL